MHINLAAKRIHVRIQLITSDYAVVLHAFNVDSLAAVASCSPEKEL